MIHKVAQAAIVLSSAMAKKDLTKQKSAQSDFLFISVKFLISLFSCNLQLNLSPWFQQLLYSIVSIQSDMKPKKKTTVPTKKASKKVNIQKPLLLLDKTLVTTKVRTNNTTQEPLQIKDMRAPIRTHRDHFNRFTCHEKLQEYNFSPFSSPGGTSISPRCTRVSPSAKQEKQKKRQKQKPLLQSDNVGQKRKFQQQKRQIKVPSNTAKEQCNLTYQNFVLKKLGQKKITELSQESQNSTSRFYKGSTSIQPLKEKESKGPKSKILKMKQLKDKILEKYKREFPSLKRYELNFYCSIVLIQRLWRQKRIRSFISQFISPRSNPQCNITVEIQRESNLSKLETTGITSQERTSQLIRKYHNISSIFQKKDIVVSREIESTEMKICLQKPNQASLKDLELSAQLLSPQKEKKFIRFVECVRDIAFMKPSQPKKKYKMNVFNLQESWSQKCLIHSFYSKIFKNSPTKTNNFQILTLKKQQKQLQRSIQLINNIKSPNKPQIQILEVQEIYQTQMRSEEAVVELPIDKNIVQKVQTGVDTNGIEEYRQKQSRSLKEINVLAEEIIFFVLAQFCEQFHAFTTKSILRKKKKNSLPGLKVTPDTIKQYLTGLTEYMMKNYEDEVIRRFSLINPLNFLKIHHQYDDQDDYISEDQDQMNMPIIPNTLFYQYQLLYESQKFIVKEEDRKFSNFLQSLIKIHNLLLSNCLSEVLEKKRVERMILPWDNKFNPNRHKNTQISRKGFQSELSQMVDALCKSAFLRLGQFYKRLDDLAEQQKLLDSISLQYKQEGNEWSAQYQFLELRMDITNHVQQMILEQLMQDIMIFF